MTTTILFVSSKTLQIDTSIGYIIGAILAFFVLIYLLYSLVKPEKF
jgi:K+-transporting ATPase KdpF subunit